MPLPVPDDRPIQDERELVEHFARANKVRGDWRVGTEHEKIGVVAATGEPLPYEGPRGIAAILGELSRRHGWSPIRENDAVIGLARAAERVSLEPGGQLEHSGAPHARLASTEEELRRQIAELVEVSEPLGVAWLGLGFRPFGTLDDVPWVPKGRYAVMREYLPQRARLPLEMMKRTATVQANVDWSDEDDAERKMRAAMSVTSIVTALFASSPLVDGKDSGYQSYRAAVWLETDPDRCGLLPFVFERGGFFTRYVQWALDVPMFFVYRGTYRPVGGMTFRRFLREGFEGERATIADWELHLSTLFPEARLRHYVELRGADSGPLSFVLALPALWKGLLYDCHCCGDVEKLTSDLTLDEREALRRAVPRLGLETPLGRRRRVRDAARELVAIARGSLSRFAPDEVSALAPLEEVVETGRTWADRIRDVWAASKGDPHPVVEFLRY